MHVLKAIFWPESLVMSLLGSACLDYMFAQDIDCLNGYTVGFEIICHIMALCEWWANPSVHQTKGDRLA